ncbi:MAG TPA: sugar phosphate nucleotidyltransferase [Candidatus Acidoferrum sp.]|nr:sugar phosphate nucleotidyltransferase [Candidatus Acidoferrum sp.]
MAQEKFTTHAVILAGGRGTRFWPRSRTRAPKQLLNIVGDTTMLEQTVERLRPLIPLDHVWTVTNAEQTVALGRQLPAAARKHVLSEPVGRNTAAAIALAAIHVRHAARGDALMAILPADHFISQPEAFRKMMRMALDVAREPGRMAVLGIPPSRPDTGFGYIERIEEKLTGAAASVYAVRRFTEKPELRAAREYVDSGNYHWNAGMFFWRASTFLNALRNYLPKTYEAMEILAKKIGKPGYNAALKKHYAKLENISVDYAILEPATRETGEPRVFVVPAEIGWSDIGSWAAVYELLAREPGANSFAGPGLALDAEGNLLYSPKKFIAAIGVRDLIVVDTADALLICPRNRAQDVGKVVKALEEQKNKKLL